MKNRISLTFFGVLLAASLYGQILPQKFNYGAEQSEESEEASTYTPQKPRNAIFPLRGNVNKCLYFYGENGGDSKFNFLGNTALFFSPNGQNSSVTAEIASDYFSWGRISVLTQLAKVDSTENLSANQAEAIQQLIGGGGNVVLKAEMPMLFLEHRKENMAIKMDLTVRGGLDLPAFGSSKPALNTGANVNPSLDGVLYYRGVKNQITLFGSFRIGGVWGNQTFYQTLGKADETGFLMAHFNAGIDIANTVRISWNYYTGSPFVRNNFVNAWSADVLPGVN